MDDLKAAAFEYLLLNPGSEFGDWREGLIEQYPAEVVADSSGDCMLHHLGMVNAIPTRLL